MRKHLSVFVLDIVKNLKVMMIFIGAVTVMELAIFLIFGLEKDTFGEAVSFGQSITGSTPYLVILTILVWMPVLIRNSRRMKNEDENNKTVVHTEYLTRRLLISERAAVLWSALASSLRFVFAVCFQVILIKIMYLIYLKYGNGSADQLTTFVDMYTAPLLAFLFPGKNISQWLFMGVLTVFVGVVGAATVFENPRAKDAMYIIVFFLIVFLGGYDRGFNMDVYGAILLGLIALIVFAYMMIRSHTGKRPAKEEMFRVISHEKY